MSEAVKTAEAAPMQKPPEAGISVTFKMFDQHNNDIQITMRGATADEWPAVLSQRKALIETTGKYGWRVFENGRPQAAPQSAPMQQLPTAPATTQTQPANGLSFTANVLCVEFNPKNGEKVAKLKGGQLAKYGVRLWPEVAEALGFDLAQYQAGDHSIQPIAVAYTLNEQNKPQKITGRAA